VQQTIATPQHCTNDTCWSSASHSSAVSALLKLWVFRYDCVEEKSLLTLHHTGTMSNTQAVTYVRSANE